MEIKIITHSAGRSPAGGKMDENPCANCGIKSNDVRFGIRNQILCQKCFTVARKKVEQEYKEYKAQRKAQLAAMPRCCACSNRGNFQSYGVLLCGRHLKKIRTEHNRRASTMGGIAL